MHWGVFEVKVADDWGETRLQPAHKSCRLSNERLTGENNRVYSKTKMRKEQMGYWFCGGNHRRQMVALAQISGGRKKRQIAHWGRASYKIAEKQPRSGRGLPKALALGGHCARMKVESLSEPRVQGRGLRLISRGYNRSSFAGGKEKIGQFHAKR